jgi:hypothetical protein
VKKNAASLEQKIWTRAQSHRNAPMALGSITCQAAVKGEDGTRARCNNATLSTTIDATALACMSHHKFTDLTKKADRRFLQGSLGTLKANINDLIWDDMLMLIRNRIML